MRRKDKERKGSGGHFGKFVYKGKCGGEHRILLLLLQYQGLEITKYIGQKPLHSREEDESYPI